MKKQFVSIYNDPTWEMYECDNGARWTAVKGGTCVSKENDECQFSGCPEGHFIHIKGETKDRSVASDWVRHI